VCKLAEFQLKTEVKERPLRPAAKGYLTLSTIFHPTQHLKHFFFSISDLMPLVVFIDIHVLKQVISATIFKQPFSVFVEIFY